jgi:hypothetical protein
VGSRPPAPCVDGDVLGDVGDLLAAFEQGGRGPQGEAGGAAGGRVDGIGGAVAEATDLGARSAGRSQPLKNSCFMSSPALRRRRTWVGLRTRTAEPAPQS